MLTALRGVTSHEDAPMCLFSKDVWKEIKEAGGIFRKCGGY